MSDPIFKAGAGRALFAVLLLSSLLMLYGLDGTAHRGRFDDVDRALVARDMAASGNWVVPYLGIHPLVTKPPLMYWTAAALYKLTGRRDELPANLTSVLSMLIAVACTWWMGRNFFGWTAALRAGLILPTMYFFLDMSRHTLLDSVMVAALMVCAAALVQLSFGEGRAPLWRLVAIVALAGVIMAKGPVGLPLVVLIAVPLLWGRSGERPGWLEGMGHLLLLAALVLPWFFLVLHRYPPTADVWRAELVGRMGDNELTGTWPTHPAWFYIPQLVGTMPWLPFLILVAARVWRGRRERAWITLLVWVVGGFLFFSLVSSSKRVFYLLPLYPGMALMIAGAWPDWFAPGRVPGRAPRIAAAVAVGAELVGGLLFLALPLRYPGVPRWPFWVGGAAALACGAWGVGAWHRWRGDRILGSVVAGATCLYLVWFGHLVPLENAYLTYKPFFAEASPLLGPAKVVMTGLPVPRTLFYLDSHPYLNEPPGMVLSRLRDDPRRKVVTTPDIAAGLDFLKPVLVRTVHSPFGAERSLGLYAWDRPDSLGSGP